MIGLLKRNLVYNHNKFYPYEMFQYNINLDPLDVKDYIDHTENFNFVERIYYVNPVSWKKTINLLKPINSVYIFMKERKNKGNSTTKKIFISSKKRTKRKYI